MKRRTEDLAVSIANRDDADALRPDELEMISLGREEVEQFRAWVVSLMDLIEVMKVAKTIGDARRIIAQIEALDRQAEAL